MIGPTDGTPEKADIYERLSRELLAAAVEGRGKLASDWAQEFGVETDYVRNLAAKLNIREVLRPRARKASIIPGKGHKLRLGHRDFLAAFGHGYEAGGTAEVELRKGEIVIKMSRL